MKRISLLLAIMIFTGCGDSGPKDLTISFATRVGTQPFACTSTYEGVGTNAEAAGRVFTPQDMRYYIHDVRLITTDGAEQAVTLTQDGVWQNGNVALLDFEDASGTCVAGTTGTNSAVKGQVPAGDYAGLVFLVGVPEDVNHLKVDDQPSPLNLSALFWNWTAGYKFTRIEGTTSGALLHLGSTGCTPVDASDLARGATCVNSNRVEARFAAFDPDKDQVVLDLAALFAETDLTANTTGTAKGCMSGGTDPECAPLFARLGLPFGTNAGGTQSVFTR